MAVNTVTGVLVQVSGAPAGTTQVAVLQSPSGATGDSTFVIDCRPAKSSVNPSMRGRTLQILTVGTAFTANSSINSSLDGTNYETLKTIEPATIGANTVQAVAPAFTLTTATASVYVCGHDFDYLKIVTTVGDATSGLTIRAGQ